MWREKSFLFTLLLVAGVHLPVVGAGWFCLTTAGHLVAIFMESLGFQPGWGDPAGPRWAASLFVRVMGVVMVGFSQRMRSGRVAVAAGLVAVAAAAVLTAANAAGAATPNLGPICNEFDFGMPAVGQSVTIPVGQRAADPDLDPIRLVSVSNAGANIGTVVIANNGASGPGTAAIKFTLTSSTPGVVNLQWAVSDGSLQAGCGSFASNVPPPDIG